MTKAGNSELTNPGGNTRITGHHIAELTEQFDYIDLQHLIGLYMAKISQHTSAKHIDKPIEDVTRCLMIRVLLKHPEWAPLRELNNFSDLIQKLGQAQDTFPFSTLESGSAVLFGRSVSTTHSLKNGRKEMNVISMWITILLEHFEEIEKEGKDHLIYKMMEKEADSRGLTLREIEFNRGWPKPSEDTKSTSPGADRITGKDIKLLSEQFDFYDLQAVLGAYMAKVSQMMSKKNADIPIDDATRSLMVRTLLEHPEYAPLPKLFHFDDLVVKLKTLPNNFPLPTNISSLGVLIGRSVSTINGLQHGRKEMRVISTWITVLMQHLDDMASQGVDHPLYQIIKDEAASRDLTVKEISFYRGWPSQKG